MKFLFFLYLFIQRFLACDPINVYTNIYPSRITDTIHINKGIRIGFISKTRCRDVKVILHGTIEDEDYFGWDPLVAQLVSITVSKYITDGTYQIFYSYQTLIEAKFVKKLGFNEFKYQIVYQDGVEETDFKTKEFEFKSKFNLDESQPFKFAVIGNLKIDYIEKFIKIWKERQIDCLIHLGNFQEGWYNQGGKKFDEYFQRLQPITSQVPFYFLKGIHEKSGEFNGPLNNRIIQNFISNQVDNYFTQINYGKISFNFYSMIILQSLPYRELIMNSLKQQLKKKNETSKQIVIFSSYSLNCINNKKEQVCSQTNSIALRPLELYLSQLDTSALISSGYPVYQFFKMQTFQTNSHLLSNYWDSAEYNPSNYLVGTGGYFNGYYEDKSHSYIDKKMNIVNLANELGYLELQFFQASMQKVQTTFISFQDQNSQQVVEKDKRDSKYSNFLNLMAKSTTHLLAIHQNQQQKEMAQKRIEQFESLSQQEEFSQNQNDEEVLKQDNDNDTIQRDNHHSIDEMLRKIEQEDLKNQKSKDKQLQMGNRNKKIKI